MTPIEQLDIVLSYLSNGEPFTRGNSKENDIRVYALSKGVTLYEDMLRVLAKLQKDGYVTKDGDFYAVTWEGRLLNQQGGYAYLDLQRNREIQNKKALSRITMGQFWLTLILALGALIAAWYYGIEIWKYYHHSCH